jgi:hypothetical protein
MAGKNNEREALLPRLERSYQASLDAFHRSPPGLATLILALPAFIVARLALAFFRVGAWASRGFR